MNSPIKLNFRRRDDLSVKTWHAKPLCEISLVIKPNISHKVTVEEKTQCTQSAAAEAYSPNNKRTAHVLNI